MRSSGRGQFREARRLLAAEDLQEAPVGCHGGAAADRERGDVNECPSVRTAAWFA
jgi:hypothetical protein